MRRIAVVLVTIAACADLKSAPNPTPSDGGASSSSSGSSGGPILDDAGVDPDSGLLPPAPDAAVHPSEPCRPTPAACLDARSPSVIEVPTEATFDEALRSAQPLDVIQLRGTTVNDAFTLPKDVSLTACESSVLNGEVSLAGGVQSVSNLIIGGTVLATKNGSFNFRRDRFIVRFVSPEPRAALLVSTVSAPIGSTMAVAVDDSSFVGRERGIEAFSDSRAGPEGIQLTVRNGVFSRVVAPITLTEDGHNPIRGSVTSSTFYDFGTAIVLDQLNPANEFAITASLFANGTVAVDGKATRSPYRWNYSFAWNVLKPLATEPSSMPTLTTNIDPSFVDAEKDDLRLREGSLAVDRMPPVVVLPANDFNGCPRPASVSADPGAFESQP